MKTKQDNSWVERFSKLLTDDMEHSQCGVKNITELKSFIQTEIDKAVVEVLDRVEKDLVSGRHLFDWQKEIQRQKLLLIKQGEI